MITNIKFDPKTIAVGVAVVFVLFVGYFIFLPVFANKEIAIPEGAGLNQIAATLKQEKLIRSEKVFVLYVAALGEDKNLKAGKYIFEGRVNTHDIITALSKGESVSDDIVITVPEGFNIWQIDELLTKEGMIKKGEISWYHHTLEGKMFPDTYRFKKGVLVEDIKDKMIKNFDNKTSEALNGLDTADREKTIILASMLEKEAKTEEDMRIVAGIIKKRININMLTQIDAAVSYGACLRKLMLSSNTGFFCDVTQVGVANEIKIDSPYNTYMRLGLPKGPISNPGLKSIRSALNPIETEYLYYLSTRSGDRIIYSKTAAEHLVNRKKYLGF